LGTIWLLWDILDVTHPATSMHPCTVLPLSCTRQMMIQNIQSEFVSSTNHHGLWLESHVCNCPMYCWTFPSMIGAGWLIFLISLSLDSPELQAHNVRISSSGLQTHDVRTLLCEHCSSCGFYYSTAKLQLRLSCFH